MGKPLSEMTLEELWQLFPIFLTEHQAGWAQQYAEEEAHLRHVLPADNVLAIHHIGSTAIPGIWAKPIVDILVEAVHDAELLDLKPAILAAGYICMSQSKDRLSFNKGYTSEGFAEKVFHLHLHRAGDRDELFFRDYMIAHPEAAQEYEELKLRLWKQYEHDRDGYTHAKGELVARYTTLSKEQKQQPIPAVE